MPMSSKTLTQIGNKPSCLVSVVIPVFQRPNELKRALHSLKNQTFTEFEVIVVDDGSPDPAVEQVAVSIFSTMSQPCRYLRLPKNSGVSFARNRGIEIADSNWIALLDSDDEWLPPKLAAQWNHPERLRIIHGEELWFRNGLRVNPKSRHQKSGGAIFLKCLPLCCISPSAVLFEKSLWLEVGGFDETFPVCEDYDFWLKITSLYPVGYVPFPIIIKHGGHPDQLSRRFFAMDYWRVRSLDRLKKIRNLSAPDEAAVNRMILQKSQILLQGYRKHRNCGSHFQQIEEIANTLKQQLQLPS